LIKKTHVRAAASLWAAGPCLALLLAPSFAAAGEKTESFTRTVRVGRTGTLDVSNVSGDILIKVVDGDEIRVDAVKRAHARRDSDAQELLDRMQIEVSEAAGRVTVRAVHPGHRSRHRRDEHASVDFELSVPPETEVTAKTISGDVRASRLRGALFAETVSGDVQLEDISRLERAKSVSGNVTLTSATAQRFVEIGSVSGDVLVRGVKAEEIQASTVSGDLSLDDATCDRATLESVSGDIRYHGPISERGRYEFKTHSGEVELTLDGASGFDFEAKTFSGEIHSDLPITFREVRRGRLMRGVYRDGGASIRASSFSGDVVIRRR
jgi:DUF4097 and DUF4098 domain-containing protein YvlB